MTAPNKSPAPEVTSGTGPGNEINVLVVCADLGFPKLVQKILTSSATANNRLRIFPGTTKEQILKYLTEQKIHSVLVEEETITDRTPAQTLSELREMGKKHPANLNVPMVFVSAKTDAEKASALVRDGWKDVLMKPLDPSLFLQKMNLYNPALPILSEPALFTMESAHDIDVALRFKTKSISEYGMRIECTKALNLGEVVGLNAPFLALPLMAVVIACPPGAEGLFLADLMFIGVTPAETQVIRQLIRHEYAEEKQAA